MRTRHPVADSLLLACALLATSPALLPAQEAPKPIPDRAQLLEAAREIMDGQKYCALVTIDRTGRPEVRTMNPFPPDADMTVWMATNTRSLKVAQIEADPRVTVYYADHANGTGYVALAGRAMLVDDMAEIQKRRRAYWDTSFPGLKNLVLIKVVPEHLDVINYKRGANGDPTTWRAPRVEFPSPDAR